MAQGIRVELPLEERAGIYTLHHLPTGHFYVGSSKQMRKRVFHHRNCIMGGYHENRLVSEHFADWSNVHVTVTYLDTIEDAKMWEEKLLSMVVGHERCCNLVVDGVSQLDGRRGIHSSRKETRQKLAVAGLRSCSIEGVEYPSIQAAMEATGLNRGVISSRFRSPRPKWEGWKILEGRSVNNPNNPNFRAQCLDTGLIKSVKGSKSVAIQKKLSKGTAHLLAQLQNEVKETVLVGDAKMPGDLEVTVSNGKLEEWQKDYRTTTAKGERSVSVDDIEAVGNWRRDMQNAVRMFGGDNGVEYLEEHTDSDSFRVTLNTEDNALSIQAAFYRPGKEEQGNTNFISITDQWAGSEEDKAIENHLKGLTKRLAGGKK